MEVTDQGESLKPAGAAVEVTSKEDSSSSPSASSSDCNKLKNPFKRSQGVKRRISQVQKKEPKKQEWPRKRQRTEVQVKESYWTNLLLSTVSVSHPISRTQSQQRKSQPRPPATGHSQAKPSTSSTTVTDTTVVPLEPAISTGGDKLHCRPVVVVGGHSMSDAFDTTTTTTTTATAVADATTTAYYASSTNSQTTTDADGNDCKLIANHKEDQPSMTADIRFKITGGGTLYIR